MSEYTPTTETLGHGSIKLTYYPSSDRIGVEQTGVNSVMDSWELVRFVRELGLLAAHDAEVRAGVVAEEPEWGEGIEYGYEDFEHGIIPLMTGYERIEYERPVRYGPWVLIEN